MGDQVILKEYALKKGDNLVFTPRPETNSVGILVEGSVTVFTNSKIDPDRQLEQGVPFRADVPIETVLLADTDAVYVCVMARDFRNKAVRCAYPPYGPAIVEVTLSSLDMKLFFEVVSI